MCEPPTSSSAATRIFSLFRTTKPEALFLGAAARVAGYSDKSFRWARKTRWPLQSTPSRSSAASRLRATTSGVTLAGRKERLTGSQRQHLRLPSCRRRIGDKAIEARTSGHTYRRLRLESRPYASTTPIRTAPPTVRMSQNAGSVLMGSSIPYAVDRTTARSITRAEPPPNPESACSRVRSSRRKCRGRRSRRHTKSCADHGDITRLSAVGHDATWPDIS
jgi:hypothetical protein